MKPLASTDPTQIGPHRVLAVLGVGGMGKVYLARTPARHLAAVKVVHQELAENPTFRARFAREARVAQMVRGPFTPAVFDAAPDAETPWMATEYVPGPTLTEAVITNGPFPEGSLRVLTLGLARALQAIHGAGLIHRDLKPSNVLLSPRGPQVIDFGIARAIGGTVLTKTGEAFGTPSYTAPETILGRPQTPESDIFSLAGVVIYASRGMPPFGQGPAADVLHRIVDQEPDLRSLPEGTLKDLLARCLAKEPRHRPTADEIVDVLSKEPLPPAEHGWLPSQVNQEIGHREQALRHVVSAVPPASPGGGRSRTHLFVVGAAAAALLVLAGVGLVMLRPWEGGHAATTDPEESALQDESDGAASSDPSLGDTVYGTYFSADGDMIYVHTPQHLSLWDWRTGEFIETFEPTPDSLDVSEAGTMAASHDGRVVVWDSDHTELASYEPEEPEQTAFFDTVSTTQDGETVVFTERTQDNETPLHVWDWSKNSEEEHETEAPVMETHLSPDGNYLALAYSTFDNSLPRVEVRETDSWEVVLQIPEDASEYEDNPNFPVFNTAFSPDSRFVAISTSHDDSTVVHDLAKDEVVHEFTSEGIPSGLVFSTDGEHLFAGRTSVGNRSGGYQWDLDEGDSLISGNSLLYEFPTVHPEGESLVVTDSSSNDAVLIFLDPETLQDTHEIG